MSTVEPRYNDPRYNDIPGITINMLCPVKSYSNMYGTEPRYNDLRYSPYNDEVLAHRTPRYNDITVSVNVNVHLTSNTGSAYTITRARGS